MSRAVIDQFGFRTVFIGLILSLLLGLSLKAQISSQKIQGLIQDSTFRLEKDFIIDFQSAEVVLSKWGLPLPFVQISQIRMSPKKAICQDSQIYIDKLILPLSPLALITSNTLIKEISATTVELRLAELENCLHQDKVGLDKTANLQALNDNEIDQNPGAYKGQVTGTHQKEVAESIFQIKTAGLLQKIKIDQLKVVYKKYPGQPLNFRQLVIDLSYKNKKMDRLQLTSQVYGLKDPLSELMFLKGDLALVMTDKERGRIETEAKLRGRILDGEISAYTFYNSLEQNVKVDFDLRNVPLKPLIQLNLIESSWFNYPVAFQFHGFGQFQVHGSPLTILKLNDVSIAGERTHIKVSEIKIRQEMNKLDIEPFTAEIKNLDLNKLAHLSQMKSIAQSIDNFGEINGELKFNNPGWAELQGDWSGLSFIFSNRGRREIQKIDSFHVTSTLQDEEIHFKMKDLKINLEDVPGEMQMVIHQKNSNIQAEANLQGSFLDEKIWELLTGVSQKPKLKLNWNFKKSQEERHLLNLTIDDLRTDGLRLENTNLNMIQSSSSGISTSLALAAKASQIEIEVDSVKSKLLQQIFNPQAFLHDKNYVTDPVVFNLKGTDWKSMTYDFETHLKAKNDLKNPMVLKGRGDWKDDDSATGSLSVQSWGQLIRYDINKKDDNTFEVQAH